MELVKSLNEIIENVEHKEIVKAKPEVAVSRKARREMWDKSVETQDMESIEKIDNIFSNFVTKHMLDRVEMTEPRELEQSEIDSLASEIVDIDQMIDLLNARRAQIRSYTFTSLDEKYEKGEGVDVKFQTYPVEYIPGSYESPANGIKLTREGGNRGKPGFDEKKLRSVLTDDQTAEVFRKETQTITTEVFDEDKLLDMVNNGDVDLEKIRDCVTPGKHSSPRFQVRRMK